MRLIDADALKIELALLHGGDYKAIHYLNHAPTVDAVPVIRCRECSNLQGAYLGDSHAWICTKLRRQVWEHNYCCWAERKEE